MFEILSAFFALIGFLLPGLGIVIAGFTLWIMILLFIEDPKAFIKSVIPFIWFTSVVYYLVVYGSSMLISASSFMMFLAILFGGAFISSWIDDWLA